MAAARPRHIEVENHLVTQERVEALPRLEVILGRCGDGPPFLLRRVDHPFVRPHITAYGLAAPRLRRPPGHYLRTDMSVATSGDHLPAAFVRARDAPGVDRILLGTHHPYEEMGESPAFLGDPPLTDEEADLIFEGNAAPLGLR